MHQRRHAHDPIHTFLRNLLLPAAASVALAALPGCSGDDGQGTSGTSTGTATGTTGGSTAASTSTSTSTGTTTATTGTTGTDTGTDTGTSGSDTGTAGSDTGTGGSTGGVGLEIAGSYMDEWGISHEISDDAWKMDTGMGSVDTYHVLSFDNDANYLVAQNDAQNAFNPNLYSRFDWTEFDGALWYCQTVFDAATPQDAENATPADPTDPSVGGCGSFPWTNLTP